MDINQSMKENDVGIRKTEWQRHGENDNQRDTKGPRIIRITVKLLLSSFSNKQTDRNTVQTEKVFIMMV